MAHTGSYYSYTPSKVAPYIFAIIYIITTLITFIQTIRLRSWIWLIMILASFMETIGYLARIVSIRNVDKNGPYVISFLLIVLAPVVIAASIYILFGRIVFYVTPIKKQTASFLWVPPRFLTLIFVSCDLLAFVMQGIGAVRVTTGTTASSINSGKNLATAGLVVQLAAFGFFSIISIRFNIKSRNFDPVPMNSNDGRRNITAGDGRTPLNPNWKGLLLAINFSCGLILIRSVYRMLEFTTGKDGYISTHEWTFYIFDAVPIYPIFLIFLLMPPGNYVPYLSWRVPKKRISTSHRLEAQSSSRGQSGRHKHSRRHSHTNDRSRPRSHIQDQPRRSSHTHGQPRRPSHSHRHSHHRSHSDNRPLRQSNSQGRSRRHSRTAFGEV